MKLNFFRKETEESSDPFNPPHDPVFSYLYSRVVVGALPLYQAEVQLKAIRPYAPKFQPHTTKEGKKVLQAMLAEYKAGKLTIGLWLYPDDASFVLSDDYFPFYLLKELGAENHWCEVMGQPLKGTYLAARGPAPLDYVRKLPGGPDFDPSMARVQVLKER